MYKFYYKSYKHCHWIGFLKNLVTNLQQEPLPVPALWRHSSIICMYHRDWKQNDFTWRKDTAWMANTRLHFPQNITFKTLNLYQNFLILFIFLINFQQRLTRKIYTYSSQHFDFLLQSHADVSWFARVSISSTYFISGRLNCWYKYSIDPQILQCNKHCEFHNFWIHNYLRLNNKSSCKVIRQLFYSYEWKLQADFLTCLLWKLVEVINNR